LPTSFLTSLTANIYIKNFKKSLFLKEFAASKDPTYLAAKMRVDVGQLCVEASRAEKQEALAAVAKANKLGNKLEDTSICSTAQLGTEIVNGLEMEEAESELKENGNDESDSSEHNVSDQFSASSDERNLFAGAGDDPDYLPHSSLAKRPKAYVTDSD
jgi:hypothetical protein